MKRIFNLLLAVITCFCSLSLFACDIEKPQAEIISKSVKTVDNNEFMPDFSITMPFSFASTYSNNVASSTPLYLFVSTVFSSVEISRSSGDYTLYLSSLTARNGYYYTDRWTSDKMTNISAPVEIGLLHMFNNFADVYSPNEIDIAFSYTCYYRYLSQWFDNVRFVPFTSPITGKTYETLPEPPVFYNDVNKLIGCTYYFGNVFVANKSSNGFGEFSCPLYFLEFSDNTAFPFILFPSDFGDAYVSNDPTRYSNISPYFVGYNAMFDSTTGYQVGYDNGYEAGYAIGRDSSYSNGYSAGYAAGSSGAETGNFLTLFTTIADSQLVLLKGFLDFEFLGFNMLNFFKGLMTVLIAIMVVRLITSGSTSS